MEELIKRKPGRPVGNTTTLEYNVPAEKKPLSTLSYTKEPEMKKVGHFIVVNTPTLKGIRINLEKVRTYAKAGQNDNVIQLAWDNGTASAYQFGSEADAYAFLELLDEHCL